MDLEHLLTARRYPIFKVTEENPKSSEGIKERRTTKLKSKSSLIPSSLRKIESVEQQSETTTELRYPLEPEQLSQWASEYECAWSCVMHCFFQRGGLVNSKRRQRPKSKEAMSGATKDHPSREECWQYWTIISCLYSRTVAQFLLVQSQEHATMTCTSSETMQYQYFSECSEAHTMGVNYNISAARNQTFYCRRAACAVSWDLIESQRLPRPDSMAKPWKTSTWPKSTNLWLYQTWDSSSATRNFKKTNWPSETLLRCRPYPDVWPKPAGDKLHGFVHLWHDGWRPRLCRGWDPRTPWHEWIWGDTRNRTQRSQE